MSQVEIFYKGVSLDHFRLPMGDGGTSKRRSSRAVESTSNRSSSKRRRMPSPISFDFGEEKVVEEVLLARRPSKLVLARSRIWFSSNHFGLLLFLLFEAWYIKVPLLSHCLVDTSFKETSPVVSPIASVRVEEALDARNVSPNPILMGSSHVIGRTLVGLLWSLMIWWGPRVSLLHWSLSFLGLSCPKPLMLGAQICPG